MILLTGASGFIGRHLLLSLVEIYGRNGVVALTSAPVDECPYIIHHGYSFDEQILQINGYADSIETIIHAGAFTPKTSSEANDWQSCNQNIYSVDKLLRLSLTSLKRIIYLSTLDVYGATDLISEESVIEPASLYGHSKLYGEKLITCWAESKGILSQILRIGHVYGPGEEAYKKIIPLTMERLIHGEAIELWGDGTELRAFIYIHDVIKAIIRALDLDGTIGPVNLVSDKSISVKDIVQLIIKISGLDPEILKISAVSVPKSLRFDNSKMRKYLLPEEYPLEEGLNTEWSYMLNLK